MKYVKEIIRYYSSGVENKGWLGNGIVTVILDTGVEEHPELNGRLLVFKDFVSGKSLPYDDNGHGTHVAGIVGGYGNYFMGVAPACGLISVKVLDKYGNGRIEDVTERNSRVGLFLAVVGYSPTSDICAISTFCERTDSGASADPTVMRHPDCLIYDMFCVRSYG